MASIPALEFGSPLVAALGFMVGLLATAAILQQLGKRAETSCIWTVGMGTVIGRCVRHAGRASKSEEVCFVAVCQRRFQHDDNWPDRQWLRAEIRDDLHVLYLRQRSGLDNCC
jgi:hypothetical protein